ncbi:hypothetical protein QBC35DRAFT_474807 [Podospora australis]|uniref:Uncharacterized protein n=1 Tax=Podospora australis TaxID=1536484 RepID=A0AAN7AHU7_9PEZI|nr:hypothetical protein QBC35DRAFT_474807 [Podospora australis]
MYVHRQNLQLFAADRLLQSDTTQTPTSSPERETANRFGTCPCLYVFLPTGNLNLCNHGHEVRRIHGIAGGCPIDRKSHATGSGAVGRWPGADPRLISSLNCQDRLPLRSGGYGDEIWKAQASPPVFYSLTRIEDESRKAARDPFGLSIRDVRPAFSNAAGSRESAEACTLVSSLPPIGQLVEGPSYGVPTEKARSSKASLSESPSVRSMQSLTYVRYGHGCGRRWLRKSVGGGSVHSEPGHMYTILPVEGS